MSQIERAERAVGLEPANLASPGEAAQPLEAPRKRLSRAWFDIIVLVAAAAALAFAWMSQVWPVGCADSEVKSRAAAALGPQIPAATAVTLHLIGKLSRSPGELRCAAFARIEYADKPYAHRAVEYVVRMNREGRIVDVGATLKPPET